MDIVRYLLFWVYEWHLSVPSMVATDSSFRMANEISARVSPDGFLFFGSESILVETLDLVILDTYRQKSGRTYLALVREGEATEKHPWHLLAIAK